MFWYTLVFSRKGTPSDCLLTGYVSTKLGLIITTMHWTTNEGVCKPPTKLSSSRQSASPWQSASEEFACRHHVPALTVGPGSDPEPGGTCGQSARRSNEWGQVGISEAWYCLANDAPVLSGDLCKPSDGIVFGVPVARCASRFKRLFAGIHCYR